MSDTPITAWHQLPNAPATGTVLLPAAALADGQALLHTVDGKAAFRMVLLRSGSTIRAYANRCAHFGVPLAEKQEHLYFKPHINIRCNVHYAVYDWDTGHCASGDCDGEPLLHIPVYTDSEGYLCIGEAPPG